MTEKPCLVETPPKNLKNNLMISNTGILLPALQRKCLDTKVPIRKDSVSL